MDDGYYFGHYSFESCHKRVHNLRCGKYSTLLPDEMTCSLKLFNGETQYPGSQRETLKKMLSHASAYYEAASADSNNNKTIASGEPEHIISARRKQMDLDRSDLENICEEIACEVEKEECNLDS
jgi:hypothetical protein